MLGLFSRQTSLRDNSTKDSAFFELGAREKETLYTAINLEKRSFRESVSRPCLSGYVMADKGLIRGGGGEKDGRETEDAASPPMKHIASF